MDSPMQDLENDRTTRSANLQESLHFSTLCTAPVATASSWCDNDCERLRVASVDSEIHKIVAVYVSMSYIKCIVKHIVKHIHLYSCTLTLENSAVVLQLNQDRIRTSSEWKWTCRLNGGIGFNIGCNRPDKSRTTPASATLDVKHAENRSNNIH